MDAIHVANEFKWFYLHLSYSCRKGSLSKDISLDGNQHCKMDLTGGGQNLERQNVERPMFCNFKITNIKITKDDLFNNFIFEFIFSLFINYLHNLIIFHCKILIFQMVKLIVFKFSKL